MVCTFFGHSECYDLDETILERAIEKQIIKGVDTFYVGYQGDFDRRVFACLTRLKAIHPHISFAVVLAYPPTQSLACTRYRSDSIYPEGLEVGPPRFAVVRRNQWMIGQSDCCLCYINHPWGRAHKFAKRAKIKGLTVINIGDMEL